MTKTMTEYQPCSDDICPCQLYNDLGYSNPRGMHLLISWDVKAFKYQSNITYPFEYYLLSFRTDLFWVYGHGNNSALNSLKNQGIEGFRMRSHFSDLEYQDKFVNISVTSWLTEQPRISLESTSLKERFSQGEIILSYIGHSRKAFWLTETSLRPR